MAHTEFKDIMKLRKPELVKFAINMLEENKQLKQKRTNTGIEDALHDILDKYDSIIWEYEKKRDKLSSQMDFYKDHNLNEEARITSVKYDAVTKLVIHFKAMHNEIKFMLNKWES